MNPLHTGHSVIITNAKTRMLLWINLSIMLNFWLYHTLLLIVFFLCLNLLSLEQYLKCLKIILLTDYLTLSTEYSHFMYYNFTLYVSDENIV